MSSLERKWWFVTPVAGVSVWLTLQLIELAGMPMGSLSASQWLVFFLCFAGIQRCLSFAAWLVFLAVAPGLARKGL